jgi:hypothetical protein
MDTTKEYITSQIQLTKYFEDNQYFGKDYCTIAANIWNLKGAVFGTAIDLGQLPPVDQKLMALIFGFFEYLRFSERSDELLRIFEIDGNMAPPLYRNLIFVEIENV